MAEVTKDKNIHCGAFNAEDYWRDLNLAKLPAMSDKEANNIVLAMDELLFPFCAKDDVLITRFKMDNAHKDYLASIGICFANNDVSLGNDSADDKTIKQKSVFQLLFETADGQYFNGLLAQASELCPFATVPFTEEVCKKYNISYTGSSLDTIKKVNSKIYSTGLRDKLEVKNIAQIANSATEMEHIGKTFFKESSFIVKDEFGVSGKGNLLIESEGILERIIRYLEVQEGQGKQVKFVLEPFLDKQDDFSCQFYIDQHGQTKIISVQKLQNNDFIYLGSCTAEKEFLDFLECSNYFDLVQKIGDELFREGYNGHVCMDSMVLKNGELEPIVEINARKSMSLIKHYTDLHVSKFSVQGNMTCFFTGGSRMIEFGDILEAMDRWGILWKPGMRSGFVPMSPNSLLINKCNNRTYKGRLYSYIIADRMEERTQILHRVREYLGNMSFAIYN
jgi:hypothetical protein